MKHDNVLYVTMATGYLGTLIMFCMLPWLQVI